MSVHSLIRNRVVFMTSKSSTYTASAVLRSTEHILRDVLRWPPSTLALPSWRTSLELDMHLLTIQINCLAFLTRIRLQSFSLQWLEQDIKDIEQASRITSDSRQDRTQALTVTSRELATHILLTALGHYASGISALQYHVCKLLILSQAAERWNVRINGFARFARVRHLQRECVQYDIGIRDDR